MNQILKKIIVGCFELMNDISPVIGIMDFKYQTDAVSQAIRILKKYNGCLIADVVGLGKTFVSLMIIKEIMKKEERTLIVIPPSLENTWKNSINVFKDIGDFIDIISYHQLEKVKKEYDYIIVDESHNFRNSTIKRHKNLIRITKNKKVILLTATPIQNSLYDLYGQLILFDNGLIVNYYTLEQYLKSKQALINGIIKNNSYSVTQKEEKLSLLFGVIKDELISKIMIRRTRKNLQNINTYREDLQKQNIIFPEIKSPIICDYNYGLNDIIIKTLSYIKQLSFANYNPFKYLNDNIKAELEKNEKIKIDNISNAIDSLFKTILLKRLDSSIYSFKATIKNIISKIEKTIDNFHNGIISIDDEINLKIKSMIKPEHLLPIYLGEMLSDLSIFYEINNDWLSLIDDNKILKLKDILKNLTNKTIIFSEYADTVEYLYQNLKNDYKVLKVTSANRKDVSDIIAEEFDANYIKQTNNYQILVTSDTLSEGVNLHRADTVINFDITWNPQRITQRIGRVDRIGSKNEFINIFNFTASEIINSELYLTETVKHKLNIFNSLIGADNKMLFDDEVIEDFDYFSLNNDDDSYTKELEISKKLDLIDNKDEILNSNVYFKIKSKTLDDLIAKTKQEYSEFIEKNKKEIDDLMIKSIYAGRGEIPSLIIQELFDFEQKLAILSFDNLMIIKNDDEFKIYADTKLDRNVFFSQKRTVSNIKTPEFHSLQITPIELFELFNQLTDIEIIDDSENEKDYTKSYNYFAIRYRNEINEHNFIIENSFIKLDTKTTGYLYILSVKNRGVKEELREIDTITKDDTENVNDIIKLVRHSVYPDLDKIIGKIIDNCIDSLDVKGKENITKPLCSNEQEIKMIKEIAKLREKFNGNVEKKTRPLNFKALLCLKRI